MEKTKIAIVEDNEDINFLLTKILTKEGYQVDSYKNALTALENINFNTTKVIISDIIMPNMNGIQFCSLVKEKNKNIYFIIITSKTSDEDLIVGFEAGANDYIKKPFNAVEVLSRVKTAIKFYKTCSNNFLIKENIQELRSKLINFNELNDKILTNYNIPEEDKKIINNEINNLINYTNMIIPE